MATLFGKTYARREVRQRVGDLIQVAGAERFTYDDGVQNGVKAARVVVSIRMRPSAAE